MDGVEIDNDPMRLALSLAEVCKIGYRKRDSIEMTVGEVWQRKFLGFVGGDTLAAFAFKDPGGIVLSFRGADSLAKWLAQSAEGMEQRDYGSVHRGVYQMFDPLRGDIERIATDAADAGIPFRLAGHGLGGAMALMAVLETRAGEHPATRLVTFGQPKILDEKAATFARNKLGDRYWRFVNNDDAVPRMPPHLTHTGRLFRFDAAGELMTDSVAIPPVTSEEYATLKKHVDRIFKEAGIESQPNDAGEGDAALAGILAASVEGLVEGILDHRIGRYYTVIRRLADPRNDTHMSPSESISLSQQMAAAAPDAGVLPVEQAEDDTPLLDLSGSKGEQPFVSAVLRLASSGWTVPTEIEVQSYFGSICTIRATEQQLEKLKSNPGVHSIEISRPAGIEELHKSLPFTRGNKVQEPDIGEKGEACVFALIDTGIDVLHKAFSDGAKGSRILAIWHQGDRSTGRSPREVDPSAFSHSYGRLYTAEDIGRAINDYHEHGINPDNVLRDRLGSSGHGTHVASIGAGGSFGENLIGMAPKAPIVAVIADMNYEEGSAGSLGYSMSHVDALRFLKDVAAGGNSLLSNAMPMVVNVSLGMNAGAHDGQTPLEIAFDMMTGHGREPGVAIVKSAGNEGGLKGHSRVTVAPNGLTELAWESANIDRRQDYIEIWFDEHDELSFEMLAPTDVFCGRVDRTSPESTLTVNGNTCRLRLTTNHRDNGDNQLIVEIVRGSSPIKAGRWRLDIFGERVRSSEGIVDAWVERIGSRPVSFAEPLEDGTLSIPGTADSVITVAACNSNERTKIYEHSSRGLTRSDQPKPDIAAPGVEILAAAAGQSDLSATAVKSGTSMAAPHVAGAIALVFSARAKQAKPQFNAQQIRSGLTRNARDFISGHRRNWGFGKLDAEAFFKDLMRP